METTHLKDEIKDFSFAYYQMYTHVHAPSESSLKRIEIENKKIDGLSGNEGRNQDMSSERCSFSLRRPLTFVCFQPSRSV